MDPPFYCSSAYVGHISAGTYIKEPLDGSSKPYDIKCRTAAKMSLFHRVFNMLHSSRNNQQATKDSNIQDGSLFNTER